MRIMGVGTSMGISTVRTREILKWWRKGEWVRFKMGGL
jgi:hypothetical protein